MESVGAKLFLIDQHYKDQAERLTWTWHRFLQLCAALKLTPRELAAVIRWSARGMRTACETNKFPGPVELHLTMIENWAHRHLNPQPVIFPLHNQ